VRSALGIDEEQPVLISVGRQDFQKAHDRLFAGLALLRDRIPSVRLLLAGRRSHASDRLDALSRELDLDGHVDRLGHRPDVPDLLAAADVFVLSSRFEGLPGCVIEALALELPVISAAIPSVAGLVVDEHNGLLVDSGTGFAGEMADAAARLFGDSGLRRVMGERGREIFESRFTLEESGRRMFELYETLCGTSRGA
jgi:glycosyltransferase involved in cell wall biosynthesis